MGAGMEARSIRADFLDLEVTITHCGRRTRVAQLSEKLGAIGTRNSELTSNRNGSLIWASMARPNFLCYAHALP